MAGRRKVQVAPNDPQLNEAFWLSFSDVAEPTVRNKLLFLAMVDVGKLGASEFNGVRICERLAVSASLINHYFGGRDGLIAEATAMAYVKYVEELRDAASSHSDPRDSLRSWMRQQVSWAQQNPGFAEILNYSSAHTEVSRLVRRDFQRQITAYFEFNMALLVSMVTAIRAGTHTSLPEGPEAVGREKALADLNVLAEASSVAWSTLGVAVWASGQHTPSAETPETLAHFDAAMHNHFDRIIASIPSA